MTRLPAVFTKLSEFGHTQPFTIEVDKASLDIVCESYPDNKEVSMACIRPFVSAYKSVGQMKLPHHTMDTDSCSRDERLNIGWDMNISDGFELLTRSYMKKKKRKRGISPSDPTKSPIPNSCAPQCACNESPPLTTPVVNYNCKEYIMCNGSSTLHPSLDKSDFHEQSMLRRLSESGVNLDFAANPDDVLLTLPLKLNTSTYESVIHHLNELGLHSLRRDFTSSENIFNHFKAHPVTVSKKDMFSLYPNETPRAPIIDLWINW